MLGGGPSRGSERAVHSPNSGRTVLDVQAHAQHGHAFPDGAWVVIDGALIPGRLALHRPKKAWFLGVPPHPVWLRSTLLGV